MSPAKLIRSGARPDYRGEDANRAGGSVSQFWGGKREKFTRRARSSKVNPQALKRETLGTARITALGRRADGTVPTLTFRGAIGQELSTSLQTTFSV